MQDEYNLIMCEEEREMFGLLADQGVGSIPFSPLAKGRVCRPWGQTTARMDVDPVGRRYDQDADRCGRRARPRAHGRGSRQSRGALHPAYPALLLSGGIADIAP
jgi:aryl-alcohol dehydrogenase-like predicted oxidoreductase